MIRGQKRELKLAQKREVSHIHRDLKVSIHNRFDIEMIDANTGKVKQQAYAENIVLDALWARLLSPNTYFNNIHYGTGTGTLVASRTSLFSFLGAKAASSDVSINFNYEEGWFSFQKSIKLLETEHIGATLTEVGIGYGSSSGNLVTHAQLKDMNGNPISITKSDTDIINIYATVFVHWNPNGYENGAINFAPIYSDFIKSSNRYGIRFFTFLAGLESPPPTGVIFTVGEPFRQYASVNEAVAGAKTAVFTYSAAQRKISINPIRLEADAFNSEAGLQGVSFAYKQTVSYQLCSLGFKIGKRFPSTIVGEAIATADGTTKDFATAFPFVTSGSNIYVDGLEQTAGVTIYEDIPNNKNIGPYMRVLKLVEPPNAQAFYVPTPGQSNSLGNSNITGGECIFENPYYLLGLDSYCASRLIVYTSDDMETWTQISATSHSSAAGLYTAVPSEHKNKRFWKIVSRGNNNGNGSQNSGMTSIFCNYFDNYKNIHFESPPPEGAVITADYTTETVAKDENHVFDFSFEISLGEKTS